MTSPADTHHKPTGNPLASALAHRKRARASMGARTTPTPSRPAMSTHAALFTPRADAEAMSRCAERMST